MRINTRKYFFLFCYTAVLGLYANTALSAPANTQDSIQCTSTDKSKPVKVDWKIIWSPDSKVVAEITANEKSSTRTVNATNVVLEKIAGTTKFRATRLAKGTERSSSGYLNVIKNDTGKKYLSLTYLKPAEQRGQEIWAFNGYIDKTLYTDLNLICDRQSVRIFDQPELVKISADVAASFLRGAWSGRYFQVVWLEPSRVLSGDKINYQGALSYASVTLTDVFDYRAQDLDGYYNGSYLDDNRTKNGIIVDQALLSQ